MQILVNIDDTSLALLPATDWQQYLESIAKARAEQLTHWKDLIHRLVSGGKLFS